MPMFCPYNKSIFLSKKTYGKKGSDDYDGEKVSVPYILQKLVGQN